MMIDKENGYSYIRESEKLFDQITNFYRAFNNEPHGIVPILRDNPKTKEWINRIQVERDEKLTNLSIRLPIPRPKIKLPLNKVFILYPLPYKLSGRDVDNWLLHNRIIRLEEEDFLKSFEYEFGDLTKDKKRFRTIRYQKTLDKLSDQLEKFDYSFKEYISKYDFKKDDENWESIHKALVDSMPYIQQVVKSYKDIIDGYLPINIKSMESEKDLSVVQRLLFINLLQLKGNFPKKTPNSDGAPYLKAVASLIGAHYENNFKGNNGAIAKVDELIDSNKRKKITKGQLSSKLKDLEAVKELAKQMELEDISKIIEEFETELKNLYPS